MFYNSKCPFGLSEAERKAFREKCNRGFGDKEDALGRFTDRKPPFFHAQHEQIRKCYHQCGYRPSFSYIDKENMCGKMRAHFRQSGCVPPCFAAGK